MMASFVTYFSLQDALDTMVVLLHEAESRLQQHHDNQLILARRTLLVRRRRSRLVCTRVVIPPFQTPTTPCHL